MHSYDRESRNTISVLTERICGTFLAASQYFKGEPFSLSLVCATPRMHGVLAPPLAPATASPRAPHYSAHAQLIFVAIRNGSCQPEQLMRKVFCRDAKSSYGPLLPFAHTPLTKASPCRGFAAERMPRPPPTLAHAANHAAPPVRRVVCCPTAVLSSFCCPRLAYTSLSHISLSQRTLSPPLFLQNEVRARLRSAHGLRAPQSSFHMRCRWWIRLEVGW